MVPFSLPPEEPPSRSCPGEALPGLPAQAAQPPLAPPAPHLPSFATADGQKKPQGLKAAPAQAAVRINWMGTSSLLSRTWEAANFTTPNPAQRPKTKATGPSHSPARQPHVVVKQHTEFPYQPRNPRQPCLASQGRTPMWNCAPAHLRSAHHLTQSCSLLSWQEARERGQEASRPDPHLLCPRGAQPEQSSVTPWAARTPTWGSGPNASQRASRAIGPVSLDTKAISGREAAPTLMVGRGLGRGWVSWRRKG